MALPMQKRFLVFNEVYLVNHLCDILDCGYKWLVFKYSCRCRGHTNAFGFTLTYKHPHLPAVVLTPMIKVCQLAVYNLLYFIRVIIILFIYLLPYYESKACPSITRPSCSLPVLMLIFGIRYSSNEYKHNLYILIKNKSASKP